MLKVHDITRPTPERLLLDLSSSAELGTHAQAETAAAVLSAFIYKGGPQLS